MKEAHRIIITNGNQVLLGLRLPEDREGNKWHIMGGKSEPGEEGRAVAKREIREEVGIDVEPEDIVYIDEYNGWITYYYFAFYDGEVGNGDGENADVKWFNFSEILGLNLAFNHLEVLLDFLDKFDDKLG